MILFHLKTFPLSSKAHYSAVFSCLRCPARLASKPLLLSHQRREHGIYSPVDLFDYRLDRPTKVVLRH